MPGGGFFFLWRPPWLAWLVGVWSVRAWSFVRAFGLCPGIWGCPGVQAVATVRCVVFESVRAWASVRAGQPPRRSRHVRAKHLVRVSGHDASSERFYLCPGEWDCPFVRAMGMSGPKNAVRATQFVRARKRLARVDARHQRMDNFLRGLPATRSLLRGRALSGRLRMDTWKCLDT